MCARAWPVRGEGEIVRDIDTSSTGHVKNTVEQDNGARFKLLAKNVISKKTRGGCACLKVAGQVQETKSL